MKKLAEIKEYSICFVIHDNLLYSHGESRYINVYDLKIRQWVDALPNHPNNICCMSASSDYLCSGCENGDIVVCNLKTKKVKLLENNCVIKLIISPNDNRLYSTNGTCIDVWDLQTHEQITSLKGHSSQIMSLSISMNNYLCSGDRNDTRVWDLENYEQIALFSGGVTCLVAGKDNYLYTSDLNSIKVWDLSTCQQIGLMNINDWVLVNNMIIVNEFLLISEYNNIYIFNLDTFVKIETLKTSSEIDISSLAVYNGRIYMDIDNFIGVYSNIELSQSRELDLVEQYLEQYANGKLINICLECFIREDMLILE